MKSVLTLSIVASLLIAGCGAGGYIIKPIPLNEKLVENVVDEDGGFFVSDRVAIVDVDGMIMNVRGSGGLFGGRDNPMALFTEKMDKAQADPRVKAVVLRINSPGGGVTASDIMYHRVMRFKECRQGVPVIALVEDVGASGAYYIACSSDCIIASPTSITGSIGVIVQTFSLYGSMQKIGMDAKAVISGPYKDMASPLKPLSPADEKLLQAMVNEYYLGFVNVVATGRPKLGVEKVKELADGRVYTGKQAAANGLADCVGYLPDAIAMAKERAGIKNAKTVMYTRPYGQKQNIYSETQQQPAQVNQINLLNIDAGSLMSLSEPQFMYLWTGAR